MQINSNISVNEKEVFVGVKNLEKELKEQKKVSDLHLYIFDETLKNLSKDKEEVKKYMKRVDCLLRTTQIFICICIILFSVLFFKCL